MPTRKKNRLNKKGKRRNISRKMWGGDVKNEFEIKWRPVDSDIKTLQTEINDLTTLIGNLNNDIDKAQKKIDILYHNNNIIPTNTYQADKTSFKIKLKEFETAYGSMKIDTIALKAPTEPAESMGDYAAKKTNYNVVEEEYDSLKKIYQLEKEHNNTSAKLRTTKTRTHDYFKNYKEVPILFNSIKQKYDTIIISETYDENVKNSVIRMIDFKYTNGLIDYYKKIKVKLKTIIEATSTPVTGPLVTDNLQNSLTNINKIYTDNLTGPTKKEVEKIQPIDKQMYIDFQIDKTDDIAYIFYRLHDVELVKTFLEEWLKVLKEEKKVEEVKEEVEKGKGKVETGKLLGGAEENKIENKLNELLSKIYVNKERDIIQKYFNESSQFELDDKIENVPDVINNFTKLINEYKAIHRANQQIINKIITSKIEDESNKPEYTDVMTRKNALEILHVYDEKNSKEIKYKYKMTKDMWTDILTRVTVNDRKPLIKKILNKVEEAYDVLYQDKETTIDINFYKSIFKDNPFPYRELINVTRTGEGVTPIIYGIEELFKLYEDELEFIKDNKSNNAVKPPFKQKKIEIVHKRKNPEFPSIFDSST